MKNMGKKIRYIAFFIGVCVLLAGCGKKFDASGYTKAVLDVSYKNEIQKYVSIFSEISTISFLSNPISGR